MDVANLCEQAYQLIPSNTSQPNLCTFQVSFLEARIKIHLDKPALIQGKGSLTSGLSFGHFHENSRRKKLKLKSLKPKTQEFSP